MSLTLKTQVIAAASCDPVLAHTPRATACSSTVDAHFPDASKQSKYATIVHTTLSQGAQNGMTRSFEHGLYVASVDADTTFLDYITKNATRAKSVQLNAFAREASRSPLSNLGNNQESKQSRWHDTKKRAVLSTHVRPPSATPTLGVENDPNSQPLPLAAEDHIITVTEKPGNHGTYPLPEDDSMVFSSSRPVSPAPVRYGYVSVFLQSFSQRPLPTRLGDQTHDLQDWMRDILNKVSEPQSKEAKNILKSEPSSVLFAQQLHLAQDCGEHIEVMAQRAVNRDYYYDYLIRVYGDSTARRWITGRQEGDSHRRRSAQRASLSMRKRVLIGEGYKVYQTVVQMQMQMEQLSV